MDRDTKSEPTGACELDGAECDDPLIRLMDRYFTGEVCLRKIVRRLDRGVSSVEDLGFDPASIDPAMDALECAVVEHHRRMVAGTIVGGPSVSGSTAAAATG